MGCTLEQLEVEHLVFRALQLWTWNIVVYLTWDHLFPPLLGPAVGAQRSEEHFSSGTASFLRGGAADGWGGQDLLQGASVRILVSSRCSRGFINIKACLVRPWDSCSAFRSSLKFRLCDVIGLCRMRPLNMETDSN